MREAPQQGPDRLFNPKDDMAIASAHSVTDSDLQDFSRYRSTVTIALALLALSAAVMWMFFREDAPSIAGQPGFLFSIPARAEKNDLRASLDGPLGVAAYGDRIAVTDSGKGVVKIYSWNGRFASDIDLTRVSGLSRMRAYPTAAAYDGQGRLFVSDIVSDRIYVFDVDGRLLYRFPERSRHVELEQPVAMSIHGDELYVTDAGDSSVKVFGLDGTLAREFASREKRRVALAFPNGVGANSDGTVYVADSNNRKVLIFDSDGRQQSVFAYSFGLPRGLAVDGLGRVHVVDTFAHQVAVFTPTGRHLFSYGTARNVNVGGLNFGNGVAVDSVTARVYVTDRGANRVQVFGWR